MRATYGIAYAYVLADVGFAVYGEHNRSAEKEDYEQRVARAGVETLTFQLLASIAVPSLIIHTAVHQAQEVAKKAAKPTKLARYGPTALGLAIIPVLPFTIDHPIEHLIEEGFDTFGRWRGSARVMRLRQTASFRPGARTRRRSSSSRVKLALSRQKTTPNGN